MNKSQTVENAAKISLKPYNTWESGARRFSVAPMMDRCYYSCRNPRWCVDSRKSYTNKTLLKSFYPGSNRNKY